MNHGSRLGWRRWTVAKLITMNIKDIVSLHPREELLMKLHELRNITLRKGSQNFTTSRRMMEKLSTN